MPGPGELKQEKKAVLITGASSGLGKALTEKFLHEGYKVYGVSRKNPPPEGAIWIKADITVPPERERIAGEVKDGLSVLVNCAGIGLYSRWEDAEEEEIRKLFEVNFFAPVFLTKKLLPALRKAATSKNPSVIINVSSVAAFLHTPFMGAYSSSKAALTMFSRSLRAELIKENIRVIDVSPGRINTGFSTRAMGRANHPDLPFLSTPEKFAKAVYRVYRKAVKKNKNYELIHPRIYGFFRMLPALFPNLYDTKNLESWLKANPDLNV